MSLPVVARDVPRPVEDVLTPAILTRIATAIAYLHERGEQFTITRLGLIRSRWRRDGKTARQCPLLVLYHHAVDWNNPLTNTDVANELCGPFQLRNTARQILVAAADGDADAAREIAPLLHFASESEAGDLLRHVRGRLLSLVSP